MHLYETTLPFVLPKTGKVRCGRRVPRLLLATRRADATCPDCCAMYDASLAALNAVRGELAAGRLAEPAPSALAIIEHSNRVNRECYRGPDRDAVYPPLSMESI